MHRDEDTVVEKVSPEAEPRGIRTLQHIVDYLDHHQHHNGKNGHRNHHRRQVPSPRPKPREPGPRKTAVYVESTSEGRYQQRGGKSSDGKGRMIGARNEEPEPKYTQPRYCVR